MQPPNVFNFSCYRTFLSAYADERRRLRPQFSLASWAKRLQLAGTASLTMVLNGQRQAGPNLTRKLIQYFGFTGSEREYFQDLVCLAKVKEGDARTRMQVLERLARISPKGAASVTELEPETFAAISQWHFYALREMTNLAEFDERPARIARRLRPKLALRDIANALRTLRKLKLIERDGKGRFKPAHGVIATRPDLASEAVRRAHRDFLVLAQEAIEGVPDVSKREFVASTLSVHLKDLPQAKEMIRRFQDEFGGSFDRPKGDEVYQLNLQFFPLTDSE